MLSFLFMKFPKAWRERESEEAMDEREFRSRLQLFPVVRSRDYRVNLSSLWTISFVDCLPLLVYLLGSKGLITSKLGIRLSLLGF